MVYKISNDETAEQDIDNVPPHDSPFDEMECQEEIDIPQLTEEAKE